MATLSDLRNAPPPKRPERFISLCLRHDLVARVNALTTELQNLPAPEAPKESAAPARKMGQGEDPKPPPPPEHPRAAQIRVELERLLDEMAASEGELAVEATRTDGEWRRWADQHPPRAEGEPGHERDVRYGGVVNVDDLCADLGTYAAAWNGEALAEGDWAGIFEPALDGTGKRYEIAEAVLTMYEGRTDFRRWRSALSTTLQRWSDSVSPVTSESATSDSTAGSPAPSSEATTAKDDVLL